MRVLVRSSLAALLLAPSLAVAAPAGKSPASTRAKAPSPSAQAASSTSQVPGPAAAVARVEDAPRLGAVRTTEGGETPGQPVVTRPRLAVVGFIAKDIPPDLVAALESGCASEVARLVNADIVSAEDLRMMLNVSAYQGMMGCDSDACLKGLGDALAVQQVVSGSVRRTGERYALTLVRVDAVNSRVLERTSLEVAELAELPKAVRQATPALFGVIGKVEVWGQPEGAELFLDGARIGETPRPIIDVRSPGLHTVEIIGPTVTPWRTEFEIGAGDEIKLRATNRPIVEVEAESELWTWSGASALTTGVAASGGAGLLYFLALRNDQRLDDKTLRSASQSELNAITDLTLSYVIGAATLGTLGVAAVAFGTGALILNPARAELDEALQ